MQNASRDESDVENEIAINHFAKVWRRMREILQVWWNPFLEMINWGVAFPQDKPACNGMSSKKTVETLLNVVAAFHFANETLIFINGVYTAWRLTPTSARTSLTSHVTREISHMPINSVTAGWWFGNRAGRYPSFVRSWTTLGPLSAPFGWQFHWNMQAISENASINPVQPAVQRSIYGPPHLDHTLVGKSRVNQFYHIFNNDIDLWLLFVLRLWCYSYISRIIQNHSMIQILILDPKWRTITQISLLNVPSGLVTY